jgi:hypothetical protein
MIAQHFRQSIKGNAAAKMMHVVHADVGREPANTPGRLARAAQQAAPCSRQSEALAHVVSSN